MNALFAARLNQHPWHIMPAAAQELRVMAETQITLDDFITPRGPMRTLNGVGLINVCGVLAGGMPGIWEKLGNTDYRTLTAELSVAINDPNIRAALLYVRSPGGNCAGCTEIYDLVSTLAEKKPVIAYTDSLMCSAAYYISSAASFIYASKTASVGSIGTIYTLCDASEALKAMGVRVFQIASGDLKGGSPEAGWSAAQIADLERVIADYFEAFSSDVRKKRSIDDNAMRGQWFKADKAPPGMVDFIGVPAAAAADALTLAGGDGTLMAPNVCAAFFGLPIPQAAGNFDPSKHPRMDSGKDGGEFSYQGDTHSVGAHLNMKADGETAKHVHQGLEAIHAVHTNGDLVTGKVDVNAKDRLDKGALGEYVHTGARADRINIKKGGKHQAFTTVHEAAHLLHHQAFSEGDGKFSTLKSSEDKVARLGKTITSRKQQGMDTSFQENEHAVHTATADVHRSLADSKEVKSLKKLKSGGGYTAQLEDDKKDHQIFARAYSQHIAQESQHPDLLAGLKADQDGLFGDVKHWSPEHFEPIGAKFEALFRAKGWRK